MENAENINRLRPLYPWVLVRVLPRTQKQGSIYLPEKQNKPTIEGIVLRTYPDTVRERKPRSCAVKTGDQVTFPHYEGLPIPFLPEHEYRIIKETVITSVLERDDVDSIHVLTETLKHSFHDAPQEQLFTAVARLQARFDFVDKTQASIITSGV